MSKAKPTIFMNLRSFSEPKYAIFVKLDGESKYWNYNTKGFDFSAVYCWETNLAELVKIFCSWNKDKVSMDGSMTCFNFQTYLGS